ncbi:MAG: MBL fold metallo-hydrolase [Desulfobulbus propionicus]|nr:MAG: MBL fold metallo-hydrolase [Desulfobulbus propionicus]
MELAFHGATRNVTGSCHYLEHDGTRILVDCGLYQGKKEMEEENRSDFGFDPASIDFLLLTHAHLDHCGRIPLLVKNGFKGSIVTTAATRELARLVMFDSARIQEEEARYRNYRKKKRNREDLTFQPLYTTVDALRCLDNFVDIRAFEQPFSLRPGISTTFYDAGHILGSASILVEVRTNGSGKRVLFSGDLGYDQRAILPDPASPPASDIVVMESTYGDRQHKSLQPSIEELYQAINNTVSRNGNVLIPSFALERSQEILYYLREGVEQSKLPADLKVFLDSPMAISATEIFRRHPEYFDEETEDVLDRGQDPFEIPGLTFSRETADSMALKQMRGVVIIAGSGMCTAGRIRHHLRHNLWRKEAAVVFVGYAGTGTLARIIIDGAKTVRIFGEEIDVKADLYTIGGFSAHADQQELIRWHNKTGKPGQTYLVHGEKHAQETLARCLQDTEVIIPTLHQSYTV